LGSDTPRAPSQGQIPFLLLLSLSLRLQLQQQQATTLCRSHRPASNEQQAASNEQQGEVYEAGAAVLGRLPVVGADGAARAPAGAHQEDHEALGGGGRLRRRREDDLRRRAGGVLQGVRALRRRAWAATLQDRRRTVHREDVADAVRDTDVFDFLVDLVTPDAVDAPGGFGEDNDGRE
jgi:hypothetical protein